ncbi:MAG: ClbS/DfsB family four-helix bundle protein [Saonia sp.]
MPRPKTKEELIALSTKHYKRLMDFVDSFPKAEFDQEFPEQYLNRNIKDVLAHLHHWHLMVLDWYMIGMKGEKPDIPGKGYTWRTLPKLNLEIREKYKDMDGEAVRVLLDNSFHDVQKLIKKHTDEELFEKKKYKWTGTTSLGAYLISVSSSHYDWAYKLIRKCKKS